MRNLFLVLIITLTIVSCKKKEYVTLEFNLEGIKPQDSVVMVMGKDFMKEIKKNKDGIFKDTFKLKESGFYGVMFGNSQISTFLKNGNDLKIKAKVDDVLKTLTFSGDGKNNNEYLINRMREVDVFNKELPNLYKLDSAKFFKSVDDFNNKMTKLLDNTKKADTMLVRFEKEGLSGFVKSLKDRFNMQSQQMAKFAKGTPSPKFTNYENFKGGKTSLDDFKGKFVYIDVWATWCKPCLGQIPALKELEKEYRGKNIEFVSISTDRKEDYNTWKEMVREKELEGVQLYFGDDMNFMQAYEINSIPRFIFIDDNGNIINANAPRPTEKDEIKKLFSESGVK